MTCLMRGPLLNFLGSSLFSLFPVLHPTLKGFGSCNVNKLLSKRRFCSIFDTLYHRDFPFISQNEGVLLKMDS